MSVKRARRRKAKGTRSPVLGNPGDLGVLGQKSRSLQRDPPHKKAPGLHRGLRSVREKRTYRLTAMLACRSVGRTIGNGGLVTPSLTQRASPPLKYNVG